MSSEQTQSIVDIVGFHIDWTPDIHLMAGAATFVIYLFGIVASVALEIGWFGLLFAMTWPILFGFAAILVLLFFAALRYIKVRHSYFRYYLMIPVVMMTLFLTILNQVRHEVRPPVDWRE